MSEYTKRQRMGNIVLFDGKEEDHFSFQGTMEFIDTGESYDVQLYPEVSAKGNKYLKGPIYAKLQPKPSE